MTLFFLLVFVFRVLLSLLPRLRVNRADALHARQVRIYQPTKSTMQSAKQGTSHWQIDWDTLQGAGRWENELMGWGSTADYMQGTSMRFRTREAAIHFAEKQGWSYQVDKVQEARIPPKSYG
jgi:NADH dehydrogenase (ubiquinone) Fe-S protein 4